MEDLGVAPRGLCVKDAMTNPMVRKADRPPAGAPQRTNVREGNSTEEKQEWCPRQESNLWPLD